MILVLMSLLVVTVNLSSSSSFCASISVTSPLRDRVVFQNESFNFICSFTGEHGIVRLIIGRERIIDSSDYDTGTERNGVYYERTNSGFNVSINATTVLNNNTEFKCDTSNNGDYCSTEGILYVVTGMTLKYGTTSFSSLSLHRSASSYKECNSYFNDTIFISYLMVSTMEVSS